MTRFQASSPVSGGPWAWALLVLCVPLSPAPAATLYTNDGVVSARLEAQRWLINRARYAPEAEADAWGMTNALPNGHPDYDVCEDSSGTNDFGTTTNLWIPWTRSLPPLAPNDRMNRAASNHARDMAETGLFQHPSPSANYYGLSNSPAQRQSAEGYTNQVSGFYENIAMGWRWQTGGYPTNARTVSNVMYGLFVDTSAASRGHRKAILNNNAREMGLGTIRTNFSLGTTNYVYDYDVQDFGRTSSNHFFTDTIFHDVNTNRIYDEGEGVGGVEIHLWNGANEAGRFDASGSSGSFAVPINDLADGAEIEVELRNTNAAPVTLTLPLGHLSVGDRILATGESYSFGSYVQPPGTTNVGFRNCAMWTVHSGLEVSGTSLLLHISGLRRALYRIQYTDPATGDAWNTLSDVTATGNVTSVLVPDTALNRMYRAVLLKD